MAFTDDQIANYAQQLQQKGAPISDIQSFVQQAKQEQITESQQQAQQQPQQPDQSQQQSQGNQQIPTPGQAGGAIATGLVNALNPANIAQTATTAAQGFGNLLATANKVTTGAGALGGVTTPSPEEQQQFEQQKQQNVQAQQQAGQTLNAHGIVPPSTNTLEQNQQTADLVSGKNTVGQKTFDAAVSGIQTIGKGANEVVGGIGQAMGGQGEQGSQQSFQGLEDIVKGGLGTAFSPISGAINSIPNDEIKQGIATIGNAPGWIASSLAKWGANAGRTAAGLTPFSEDELDRFVGQPVNLATQLYLTKEAPKKAGELSQGIQDAMAKQDLSPTQIALERAATKAGMSHGDIATIRNLTPDQEPMTNEMLATALKKQNNPTAASVPSVWDAPGKEIENFLNEAHGQLRTIGQNMQDAINTDLKGKTVDATPIHDAFQGILDKMNVTRNSKGALDFSQSDIAANPTAMSGLKKIDTNLSNASAVTPDLNDMMNGKPMDARGLVSINRMINDITGVSKKGGYNATALSASLSPLKDAVDGIATDNSPLYATAKAEYGGLKNNIDNIEAAGKYGTGKNAGVSGQQILQRSLTTTGQKSSDAFQSMQNISDNYGVDAPKDLQAKAQLADLMERFSQTKPTRSLGGMMQQGGQQAIQSTTNKVVQGVPLVGKMVAPVAAKAGEYLTDINYQYFAGKIPGFKDAMDGANQAQVQTMFDLINKKDFNSLSPDTKFSVLQKVAKSIPDKVLQKISKTSTKSIAGIKKDINQ